jgi:hypothetical protein
MFALGSVHPAVNDNGTPRRDNNPMDTWASNDHSAASANAACAIDAASADNGARSDRAQCDEAACQK